jgi:hypothetical protein
MVISQKSVLGNMAGVTRRVTLITDPPIPVQQEVG